MKSKKLELKKEVIASLTNDAMANVLGGDFLTGRNTIGACAPVTHNGAGCCSGYCKPYSQEMTCETCGDNCFNKDTLYCKTVEKVCQIIARTDIDCKIEIAV
ncbi:class I lanthipeptide [Odoribacter laneus]|uniref:class I lanthipeptide n=1 Tax=Odoribacter laneus TaxID=626933 RepID=UPI003AF53F09